MIVCQNGRKGEIRMNIIIDIIPHSEQRYNTVGDWFYDDEDRQLVIRVSETGNEYQNFLLIIHELIEAVLCKQKGITQGQVDNWDLSHQEYTEPGEIRECPYFIPHFIAATIERGLAHELEINWEKYEDILDLLMLERKDK
jgi:hypothetical protein